MKYSYFILGMCLLNASCATMNDSLQLGGGLGGAAGAAATYVGYRAGGNTPSLETVAIGAGIGSIAGLITSYFTHKKLESDRKENEVQNFEVHFGDLPPSPFVVPKTTSKKGGR